MTSNRFLSCVLGATAYVAILAGCSGGAPSQPSSSTQGGLDTARLLHPATNPQWVLNRLRGAPAHVAIGRSRMSPGAKNSGLLYIANTHASSVNVFSYSKWNAVGELLGFTLPYTMCVDAAQDVYVTDLSEMRVIEYAHGAITPTRTLADHQGEPVACAIDLKTGDLAVSNFSGPTSGTGNVILYRGAKGSPTEYTAPSFAKYFFVSYDDNGNLFVDGEGSGSDVLLAELPNGKSAFKAIHMNVTLGFPGGVAWDGEFLAVADQQANTIYQFKITRSKATMQGSTVLTDATDVFQFWLTGSTSKHPQATAVIGADYGASAADKWDYPAGGTPLKTITGLDDPEGVAISK